MLGKEEYQFGGLPDRFSSADGLVYQMVQHGTYLFFCLYLF